jgi:hypothetical protein
MANTNISSSGVLGFNDTTGAVPLPSGTTAQRPGAASNGEMRFNTDNNNVEYYDGASWFDFSLVSLPPSVTTSAATSVTDATMTLNGNLTDLGGATTGTVGFYFGTNTNYASNTKYTVSTTASTGTFLYNATGLTSGTTYYTNAFAINDGGETVGAQVTQATPFVPQLITSSTSSYYGEATDSYPGPAMYTEFYDPTTTAYVTIDTYQNGNGSVSGAYSYFNGFAPYVGYNGCRGNYYGGFPAGKNYYNLWDYSSTQCQPALRICTNSTTRTYGGTYFHYTSSALNAYLRTTPPTGSLSNRVFSISGSSFTSYSTITNSTGEMKSQVTAVSGSGGGYLVHEFDL